MSTLRSLFRRVSQAASVPSLIVARWLFLRALGAIYLIAFLSLWTQIIGLVGHHGILPVEPFLQAVSRHIGYERYWLVPTLCWLNPSDGFLHILCGMGVASAVCLILDIAPAPSAAILWLVYLSLVTVCREFLGFQWDNLLLEIGFLSVFFSPLHAWPWAGAQSEPPRSIVWLLRWLLFRLMFSSGVVKWASGDVAWRTMTALTYHYETQPLPTWIGWYAHQLPHWVHQVSCVMMFGIEWLVPWFIFGPRAARYVACWVLVGFQLLIAATGNYCFFNLLTMALCLLLFEDSVWSQRLRQAVVKREGQPRRVRRWPAWILVPITTLTVLVTVMPMGELLGVRDGWPAPMVTIQQWAAPFRTFNAYGLFAVMTTTRQEIIVEGSRDGQHWMAYEFNDKPGDLARPPRFVAPHQPRLDWQMWFAALGSYQHNPWFLAFCEHLLTGSPEVVHLLARNPFPDTPPKYLRAIVYEYHFTDLQTKRAQGLWWRREQKGLYCPVLLLRMSADASGTHEDVLGR